MRAALVALALSIASMAHAAPPPVNVVNKDAIWADDIKVCQRYVAANFKPTPVVADEATTTVCNVNGAVVACRDVGSSGGFAAGFSQTRKALGADDKARQAMLMKCMSDELGWRQP